MGCFLHGNKIPVNGIWSYGYVWGGRKSYFAKFWSSQLQSLNATKIMQTNSYHVPATVFDGHGISSATVLLQLLCQFTVRQINWNRFNIPGNDKRNQYDPAKYLQDSRVSPASSSEFSGEVVSGNNSSLGYNFRYSCWLP